MAEWQEWLAKANERIKKAATESTTQILKEYSEKFFTELKRETPVDTGALVKSLIIEPYKPKGLNDEKVGYVITFDGYDEKGRPFQLIANSLNRGFVNSNGMIIPGSHFIDKCIAMLKGIDEDINKLWNEMMKEEVK